MEYHDKRKTVIPAKAGIQRDQPTGFRVKPGMTIKVKKLIIHSINTNSLNALTWKPPHPPLSPLGRGIG